VESEIPARRPKTFVIHVSSSPTGEVAGHIHHVRTGEKRRFDDFQGLSAAILGMVGDATSDEGAP